MFADPTVVLLLLFNASTLSSPQRSGALRVGSPGARGGGSVLMSIIRVLEYDTAVPLMSMNRRGGSDHYS